MADTLQLLYLIDFNGIKISDVINVPVIDEVQILKVNKIKDNREKLSRIYKTLCIRYKRTKKATTIVKF
tara:strand:- start:46 stop:252 length:207 start_codon:yes stop_codon:yes gene_type:complete